MSRPLVHGLRLFGVLCGSVLLFQTITSAAWLGTESLNASSSPIIDGSEEDISVSSSEDVSGEHDIIVLPDDDESEDSSSEFPEKEESEDNSSEPDSGVVLPDAEAEIADEETSLLAGIASDVRRIRDILAISDNVSVPLEMEQEMDELDGEDEGNRSMPQDTPEGESDSDSSSQAESHIPESEEITNYDVSSSTVSEVSPKTLDDIHNDLIVLLYSLWGMFGLMVAFKIGGIVLGK